MHRLGIFKLGACWDLAPLMVVLWHLSTCFTRKIIFVYIAILLHLQYFKLYYLCLYMTKIQHQRLITHACIKKDRQATFPIRLVSLHGTIISLHIK